MKIVTMSLKEICHLRKLHTVQGLLGRLLMCEGDGMLSFLFSNNSLIFDFINTSLSLLLPYCPKSKSIKQYFASHTAKRTILKNLLQLWYKEPLNLGHWILICFPSKALMQCGKFHMFSRSFEISSQAWEVLGIFQHSFLSDD